MFLISIWLLKLRQWLFTNHNAKFIKRTTLKYGFKNEHIMIPNENEQTIMQISDKILYDYKLDPYWKNVRNRIASSILKRNHQYYYWCKNIFSITVVDKQDELFVLINKQYETIAKWTIIKCNSLTTPIYQDIFLSTSFNRDVLFTLYSE